MGQRHAHRLRVRGAVQVDVAAKGTAATKPITAQLTAAKPENASQNPVTTRKLRLQLRAENLTRPAPAAQHRATGQTGANFGAHLMQAARRRAGAVELTGTIKRCRNRQTQQQVPSSEAIQLLIGEGNMQE